MKTRIARTLFKSTTAIVVMAVAQSATAQVSCLLSGDDCRALKPDSLCDIIETGDQIGLNGYFAPNERLHVFFTAPYDGFITEIHVPFQSAAHDGQAYIEDEIALIENHGFPNPGNTALVQGAFEARLGGPQLTEGAQNVFKFLDENQTVPMAVPVTAGQEFVVMIIFGHDHSADCAPSGNQCTNPEAATIPVDLDGCTFGMTSISAFGVGVVDSCVLGLQGDWAVRVVIESSANPVPEGACELPSGSCQIMRESDCLCEEGTYYGDGTTSCSGTPTTGACCLPGGCLDLSEANCGVAGGTFLGLGTNCLPSPCAPACPADVNSDNVVNVTDLLLLLAVWGPCPGCPEDINSNNVVDVSDLLQLLADWGPC